MKLFISYPSAQRELSERLRLALEAEGHTVFVDRADLRAGESYHEALRAAIADADRFIFFVSPESVAPGSYTLTELGFAEERWRRPAGSVLPVVIAPTPIERIPPYLRAVTLLQPRGDVVAETVAAVARLSGSTGRTRRGVLAAVALLILVGALALAWQQRAAGERERVAQQQAALRQRADAVATEAKSALALCLGGDSALGWRRLGELRLPAETTPFATPSATSGATPTATPSTPSIATPAATAASGGSSAAACPSGAGDPIGALDCDLRRMRASCGMARLREARVTVGRETFADFVAPIEPVLLQALGTAAGRDAADLQAHLGWAAFLRGRDGGGGTPDPLPRYRAAVAADADNGYAHAMWAHRLIWTGGAAAGPEAAAHFERALKDPRDRPFVRRLQFAAWLGLPDGTAAAWAVANAMRRAGEPAEPFESERRRLRADLLSALLDPGQRPALRGALPPQDALDTFRWLAPRPEAGSDGPWRFADAVLRLGTGDPASATAARADLAALARELRRDRRGGRLLDQTERLLASGT